MANFNTLEELRTKEELVNYFAQRGQSITEEEIETLKKSYEEAENKTGALTLEQLDDVARGVLEVKIRVLPPAKAGSRMHIFGKVCSRLFHKSKISKDDFMVTKQSPLETVEYCLHEYGDRKDTSLFVHFQEPAKDKKTGEYEYNCLGKIKMRDERTIKPYNNALNFIGIGAVIGAVDWSENRDVAIRYIHELGRTYSNYNDHEGKFAEIVTLADRYNLRYTLCELKPGELEGFLSGGE